MPLSNLFDLVTQSIQGFLPTKTLRNHAERSIQHDNDIIDKAYVAPMQAQLDELLPDAEPLDGKTLVLSGTTLRTGFLSSSPSAHYQSGLPAGSQASNIIADADFVLTTPDMATAINKGDEGVLELYINDVLVDSFDLGARFDEAYRDGAQVGLPASSPLGKITVTSIEKYEVKASQKLNAYATITAADFQELHNVVVLKHVGLSRGDQVSAEHHYHYDMGTVTPTVTGLDVELQTVTPKHLSGVQYAGQGSTVLLDAVGNAVFDNTYVTPLTVSGLHGVPTTNIAHNDSAVSGVSSVPVVGEVMSVADKVLTLSVANNATKDARATVTPKDPHGSYPASTSASKNILVNTFGSRSTALAEHFDDESYRLPLSWDSNDKTSSLTGNWDSTALLTNGNAQQGIISNNENGLLYPAEDFTFYLPANTADYDAFSGNQVYLRGFQNSTAKSSIQLVLAGVAGGISPVGSGDMNVEVKLPGVGGWWDCAKPFMGSLTPDSNVDGEGCLNGSISYSGGNATINATFGTNSSFGSDYLLYLRITLRNGTRVIKSIITNW